jgi:hypothetical protein
MAHPYHHALSSVKKWGGCVEDYQPIHDWFDGSKAHMADFRHRALRHHSEGVFMAEKIFGTTIINSAGRAVPVRHIGEQHVQEDLGRIPTLSDWLSCIAPASWMMGAGKTLEKELALAPGEDAAKTMTKPQKKVPTRGVTTI